MAKRVALIGLDGSGKSANITQMKQDNAYAGYRFVWVRWKPILLKPAYWLMGKAVSRKNKDVDTQQNVDGKTGLQQGQMHAEYQTKSGIKEKIFGNAVVRGIWLTMALLDYLLQFYIKVLPLLIGGKNIIFDRFFLDLFVDLGINFGYSPGKIKKLVKRFQWLFPKVEPYIYLKVSPETCYRRKNDIPNMEYLTVRYAIYECLAQNTSWCSVDGELSFEQVNAAIKDIILDT